MKNLHFVQMTSNSSSLTKAATLILFLFIMGSYNKALAIAYVSEFRIEDDNGIYWDKLTLNMDNMRFDFKDSYDALKFTNPEMNFYTFSSDNYKLSTDSRPYANGKTIVAGLTTPYQQTYYLRVSKFAMPTGKLLFLKDKYTNTMVQLTLGVKYYFTVNSNAASQGNGRFEFKCLDFPPMNASLSVSPEYPVANQAAYTIYKGYGQQTVNFSASVSGGKPGYTYSWSPATGLSSTTTANPTATPETTTTYTVTIKDANDSTRVLSKTIYVVDATCGEENEEVSVCYNDSNLCLEEYDVEYYLGLGATLGGCSSGNKGIPATTPAAVTGELKVFPNPSTGLLKVQLPDGMTNGAMMITDMNGRMVQQQAISSDDKILVDMTNSPRGMYLMHVVNGGNVYRMKISLQ